MKRSAFEQWFEAQHGKPPTTLSRGELVAHIDQEGEYRAMLTRLIEYEARKQSALYAWNAHDSQRRKRRAPG